MLGKITDVGLFTEKSEVTINHRSTADLVDSIRNKIHRLMHPEDVTDVKAVEVNGEAIDVDKELGFDSEDDQSVVNTPPEAEVQKVQNTTGAAQDVCEDEAEENDGNNKST
jgi:hypothetical protein